MRRRPTRIAAAGALLVGLGATTAGCGAGASTPPGHSERLAVAEFRIRPADLSARAGRVTFTVTNLGRLSHDLAVLRGTLTLASTPPIPPGATTPLTVTLRAGTYSLQSNVGSDSSLGMTGTLHVLAQP